MPLFRRSLNRINITRGQYCVGASSGWRRTKLIAPHRGLPRACLAFFPRRSEPRETAKLSCLTPELLPTSGLWFGEKNPRLVRGEEPETVETFPPSAVRFKPGECLQQPSSSAAIDLEPDLGAEHLPLARYVMITWCSCTLSPYARWWPRHQQLLHDAIFPRLSCISCNPCSHTYLPAKFCRDFHLPFSQKTS